MQQHTEYQPRATVIKNGRSIYTSIRINASPDRVWAVLSNFAAYKDWNSFMTEAKGQAVAGSKIEVRFAPPGKSAMTMRPTVLTSLPGRELRWLGSLLMPYIFDGEHSFILDDNRDGSTTLHQFEHFRGILVPFLWKMVRINTLQGFEQMNKELKNEAER